MPVQLVCAHCSRSFSRPPSAVGPYCSKQCFYAAGWAAPIAERFWQRVDSSRECWEWTGGKNADGYGLLYLPPRKQIRATHVAWELASGTPVPKGWMVCHLCDNPGCVRNDEAGETIVREQTYRRYGHLFLAPARGNSADMANKGRHLGRPGKPQPQHYRGERHPGAKLTDAQVTLIRQRASTMSNRAQARELGVSPSIVDRIVAGHYRP